MRALTAGLVLSLVVAAPAAAQMMCGERAQIVAQLGAKYGEVRQSAGLQPGRGVVEVFANPATGSWTIIATDVRGRACLLGAGEAFEAEPQAPAGEPS